MSFRKIFIAFVVSICCSTSLSFSSENKDESIMNIEQKSGEIIIHTVQKGETVYSIASFYNTTVEEIYKLNPKVEKGLKTGDKLKINVNSKPRKIVGYSNHLIEAKETLYSVSRMYQISEDDVKKANPGLDENTFNTGKTIRIPKLENRTQVQDIPTEGAESLNSTSEYIAQKGETLYGIGRKHQISVEALLNANPSLKTRNLKDGMVLVIPQGIHSETVIENVKLSEKMQETPYAPRGEVVRIAMLLPFLDKSGNIQQEKLAEYYEGFLIALKEMKEKGLNAEIYTFDIGSEKNTKKLESLLGTNEMINLHLIIGGVSDQQIDVLTKFSKKTGIKYVIPFGSTTQISSVPTIFQMTSSHASLYPQATKAFINKFKNHNIIFISESDADNDRSDFVEVLKRDLAKSGIQSKEINNTSDLPSSLKVVLDNTKGNVLVPSSASEPTLRKIISASNTLTDVSIALFGYPEWQAYTQHSFSLGKYNACIYSTFYLDRQYEESQEFSKLFKKWYNKNMIKSYPKFSYLGYDAGIYFLTLLDKYGSDFGINISNFTAPTLQSAVHFQKENDNGGFVNNGLYFINYKVNQGVEKIDVSR